MMIETRRFSFVLMITVVMLSLLTTHAHAYPEGILGHHGAESATCTRCHGGGVAPDMALVGSSEVISGSTVLYTLIITSNAPAVQQYAGFNLVIESPSGGAYAGGLTPVDGSVQTQFSELAHSAPKVNDAAGVARFDFEWVVPAEMGDYTIYYSGNSTNGNGATSGDMSSRSTQTLTVLDNGEPPDPTNNQPPTVTFTSPTETAFSVGSDIPIRADATDDSAVASVQLFINGDARRVDDAAPYRWNNALRDVQAGVYVVELVATDNLGVASSAVVTITVADDTITPTPAPTVTPTATTIPATMTPVIIIEPTLTPTMTPTIIVEPTLTPTITPTIIVEPTPAPTSAPPLTVAVRDTQTSFSPDGFLLLFAVVVIITSVVAVGRQGGLRWDNRLD